MSRRAVGTTNELNRVQWLQQTLALLPAGSRILDAGAGEQQFREFCAHLDYVSQDVARYDGVGDARGLQTGTWDFAGLDIVSDISAIPEPDKSFDAIMCTEVFEHIPDPLLAIKEFSRLLRPGGTLILTAPFCSLTHFAPEYFANGFSRYYYEKHLDGAGFDIVEIDFNGNYFEYLAQEVRRLPWVAERYAHRKPRHVAKMAAKLLLAELQTFSNANEASEEILCFGLHVRAVKRDRS